MKLSTWVTYLFSKKTYCQDSGKEITLEGGYVTSDGEIYCSSVDMRMFQLRSMKDRNFNLDFHSAKEVQRDIKEGRLKKFGKLESSARNNY
jgi:hypothetical protein